MIVNTFGLNEPKVYIYICKGSDYKKEKLRVRKIEEKEFFFRSVLEGERKANAGININFNLYTNVNVN